MNKPLFTKKHYEAIAGVLKQARLSARQDSTLQFWTIAGMFRELFEKDSPKFDEPKFREGVVN